MPRLRWRRGRVCCGLTITRWKLASAGNAISRSGSPAPGWTCSRYEPATSLLQASLEKLGQAFQQMLSHWARHGMRLLRINHQLELLACPLQRIAHLQRVLEMHVI